MGRTTFRMFIPARAALAAVSLSAALWASPCQALAADAPAKPKNPVSAWFSRQLEHYRSYPHLDRAYRFLARDELDRAETELRAYRALAPDDPLGREALATLLQRKGKYDEALVEADAALAAKPGDGRTLLLRGLILSGLGQEDRAAADFQAASAVPGLSAMDVRLARESYADARARQGRFDEALAAYEALAAERQDADLALRRGTVLRRLGRLDESGEAFLAAERLSTTPGDRLAAQRARAVNDLERGDPASARKLLTQILAQSPADSEAAGMLAEANLRLGDLDAAAKAARQAAEAKPDPKASEYLAGVLDKAGREDEAVAVLLPLAAQAGNTPAAARLWQAIGNLYAEKSRFEEAAAAFDQAAKTLAGKEKVTALVAESAALERAGRLDLAEAALARAQELSKDTDLTARRATLAARLGKLGEAERLFEEAFDQGLPPKTQADIRQQLAFVRTGLGHADKARGDFEAVLAQKGDDPALLSALAETCAKQGDLNCAEDAARKAYAQAPTRERARALAVILGRAKKTREAFDLWTKLLAEGEKGGHQEAEASEALANLAAALGRHEDAARLFSRAYELEPAPNADALLQAGVSHAAAGRMDAAVADFNRFLSLPGRPAAEVGEAEKQLGVALLRQGDAQAGLPHLERALGITALGSRSRADAALNLATAYERLGRKQEALEAMTKAASLGLPSWQAKQGLGSLLYALKRPAEAVVELRQAVAQRPDPRTFMALARAYEAMDKPGLAIDAMRQAQAGYAKLTPQEKQTYQAELGFYFSRVARHDDAAKAYAEAVLLGEGPAVQLRLARELRLSGQSEAAAGTLAAIAVPSLSTPDQAAWHEELGRLAYAEGRMEAAASHLEQALALERAADRLHFYGNILQSLKKNDEAAKVLAEAYAGSPEPQYLSDQGYALSAQKKWTDAAQAWEGVVAAEPERLKVWEDLAYAYLHDSENAKSIDRFKRVIDNAPAYRAETPKEREELDNAMQRARTEITKMDTNLVALGYLGTHVDMVNRNRRDAKVNQGGESADVLRYNNGVEAYFIPPVLGFRDDRVFQVLGRVNWVDKRNTLEWDDHSFQGAVGLRYKPFKELNLHLSGEKLFKIGDQSEDNWLVRGLFSWANGWDLNYRERWWNYTFLYLEGGAYLDKPDRRYFIGEARQGLTWKLGERVMLTPFLYADTRLYSPDRTEAGLIEGGPGLQLKWVFNEDKYHNPRSSFEVTGRYSIGTFVNRPTDNQISGFYLSTLIRY